MLRIVRAKVRMLMDKMITVPQRPTSEDPWGAAINLGLAPNRSKYFIRLTKALKTILPLEIFLLEG